MLRHFYQLQTRDGMENPPRGVVDMVSPSEVARIMVGNGFMDRFRRPEFFCCKKIGEELSVVNDIELSAELGIFIFQGMEAMGTHGKNLVDLVFMQYLDIGLREGLEEIFISRPSRWISAAPFFCAQDPKRNSGGLQDAHQRDGHFCISIVEASCASNPEEDPPIGSFREHRCSQAFGPLRP
jgi:hypothetical protein